MNGHNLKERIDFKSAGATRRRQFAPTGECAYCDEERKKPDPFPPHDAHRYCESGKRPHCTCNMCW